MAVEALQRTRGNAGPDIEMSRLAEIMAATGMTREQIIRAVATGIGTMPKQSISNAQLANLFTSMRRYRDMRAEYAITTPEQAGHLRRLIKKHSPVETGALKRSWDDPRTVQIMTDGSVEIDNPLPYARIQDLGGVIHRVSSLGKSYTIVIKPQHYVRKAITEYNASLAGQTQPLKQGDSRGPAIAGLITRGLAILREM